MYMCRKFFQFLKSRVRVFFCSSDVRLANLVRSLHGLCHCNCVCLSVCLLTELWAGKITAKMNTLEPPIWRYFNNIFVFVYFLMLSDESVVLVVSPLEKIEMILQQVCQVLQPLNCEKMLEILFSMPSFYPHTRPLWDLTGMTLADKDNQLNTSW